MEHAGEAVPIAELLDERRHLLEVAHWMLGSRVPAEVVVDEAYRRWYGLTDDRRERVASPRAWLTQVVGGICLARLTLPDPDGEPGRPRPDTEARETETETGVEGEASAVLLRALESLAPAERAAFVLNDVFGVSPGTVAGVVGQSEPQCAELADRARRSLRAQGAHPTSPRRHAEVVNAVRQACADADGGRLASLLAPDATAYFDGGGKLRALSRPVHGGERVVRSLLTLLSRHPRTTLDTHSVNGRTGLVARYDGRVAAVITLDIAGSHVVQVWVVLNPDKLREWNRPRPSDA
ncbi:RNA polymerase subunit sigma [Streptomyces sp. CA-251251]|uniref:RNA polymerase subunit sigma n=1 Tax=Streptomyces sp. CA-251251 TaxID=3240063 RepID=UPI003D916858